MLLRCLGDKRAASKGICLMSDCPSFLSGWVEYCGVSALVYFSVNAMQQSKRILPP